MLAITENVVTFISIVAAGLKRHVLKKNVNLYLLHTFTSING